MQESNHKEPSLYGVTDGKAVGTYLEHKFRESLASRYNFELGNSAHGIDFPDLEIDMKVTSWRQPQSSCPFRSARQKIYGLGYGLLVFVYEKSDDPEAKTSSLLITDTIYVSSEQTADYQMTSGLLSILSNNGNRDDLIAFMLEKNLPVEEIELNLLADELIQNPPTQGYITISNALQWRLQYSRAIDLAGTTEGLNLIHRRTI